MGENLWAHALYNCARTNDPFAEVGRFQVAVAVLSVIRASKDSLLIAWVERRFRTGAYVFPTARRRSVDVTHQLQLDGAVVEQALYFVRCSPDSGL